MSVGICVDIIGSDVTLTTVCAGELWQVPDKEMAAMINAGVVGIVEETENYSPIKTGRPAKLFRFNKLKYKELSMEGFHFEIKFA